MLNFNPRKQIAIIWSIEDVQMIRPDLSDKQAMEVLEFIKNKHDATLGITWETLKIAAEHLYPITNELDDEEE